jgi:hypothetical protein
MLTPLGAYGRQPHTLNGYTYVATGDRMVLMGAHYAKYHLLCSDPKPES